jgi:protein-S-isoprenylcysteine O-methyltransferase Ste14
MEPQKIMPPTWMLLALMIMLVFHFLVPVAWIIPPFWNLAGLILIGSGSILSFAGENTFHRARTTVRPFEESTVLVTEGFYRISRNPMYLGMLLILTGVALLLRSLSPFLVILPFAFFLDRAFVRVEERMLAEKFSASWLAYKEKTRRWL